MIYEYTDNNHKFMIELPGKKWLLIKSKNGAIKSKNNEFTKDLYDKIFNALSNYDFLYHKIEWE